MQLRVLLAYRGDIDTKGGAAFVMERTATALRALGVDVDVTYETYPSVEGYDLVHAFNVWSPSSALEQLRHLRSSGVPVVWQPLYLHWTETAWANAAVRAVLGQPDPGIRDCLLDELASGRLVVNGMSRHAPNEIVPGFDATLREMVDQVDHICTVSHREMQMLSQVTRLITRPYTLVPHGVDTDVFADATADGFVEHTGLRDFVLCVGAIDARKNQAMLAEALCDTALTLVLVGPCFEPDYLELVLARGGDRLVHLERLPHELIASAYKAAAVHVLPSFAEASALANLEAAAAGCPIVVSNRSSEFEYYGDLAYYCDPSDPATIRDAVLLAHERRLAEPDRWERLAAKMLDYTWERSGLATIDAYRRTLVSAGRALVPNARSFLTISFADELVGSPEGLEAYAEAFAPADDATLLILADSDGVIERLERAVAAAGLDADPSVDMIASRIPPSAWGALASRADAVLSGSTPPRGLDGLPVFAPAEVGALRRAAERRWAPA